MENLKKRIQEDLTKGLEKKISDFIQEVKETPDKITRTERIYLYRSEPYKKNRIEMVLKRLTEKTEKEIKKEFEKIDSVFSAPDKLERSLMINIVFHKSRTWGYCPIAEDNRGNKTSSITGCGYDKESTASAEILNLNNTILKRMYALKNENIDAKNGDLFGYGSGYGFLPYFEGGVGVDCHVRILEKIGFKVEKMGTNTTTILTVSD